MRGLADENMLDAAVQLLRAAGHDIAWISEDMPSVSDAIVLAHAMREDRVVITCDKSDYGSLIYQYGHPAQCGVLLFRFRDLPGAAQAQFIANTLASDAIDWRGSFTVIRTGPVPGASASA